MERASDADDTTRMVLVHLALLGGATLLIYGWTLGFDLIWGWDDELYLLRRTEAVEWFSATWRQRLLTPELGYPVPLPTCLYYLLHQLPEGWTIPAAHGLNLALHLANVALAYVLARRWLERRHLAFAAAALWAVHPLLVETVAWVTNLKGLLLGTSVLGASWLWSRHLETPTTWRALGVVGLALVGLGSRPEAAVLAPMLLVQTFGRSTERLRAPLVWGPLAALAAAAAVYLPVAFVGQMTHLADENTRATVDPTWPERLSRMAAALGLQLRHVVYPLDLDPIYLVDYPGFTRDAWLGAVAWLGLGGATAYTSLRWPATRVGWSLWWGCYLPASNIVYLPRFTADTYMYLPLLGLVLVGMVGLGRLLERLDSTPRKGLLAAILAVYVLAFGGLSWVQTWRWQHTFALFDPLTEQSPAVADAYGITGRVALRRGDTERAREIFEEGWSLLYRTGTVPMALMSTFERTGNPARAASIALKLLGEDYSGTPPEDLRGYLAWLTLHYRLDLPEKAPRRRIVRDALRRAPSEYAEAWSTKTLVGGALHLAEQDEPALARRYARRALKRDPDRCELWTLLQKTGGAETDESLPEKPAACR